MYPLLSSLRTKKADLTSVAARHGAHDLRVFGSVARGEDDESSDIDLLVRFDETATLVSHSALIRELSELLGRRVDVVSDKGLRPRLKYRVLVEAVPL